MEEQCTAMGRPKTAACNLEVSVEEIRNLPKVNKGSGGADPYAVLEILDSGGLCLVGGDRELYCKGCKTKVMKKSLDGYVNEGFELGGEISFSHLVAFMFVLLRPGSVPCMLSGTGRPGGRD